MSTADLDEFLGVVGSAEDLSSGVAVGTRLLIMLGDLHHDRGPDLSIHSQHDLDQGAYSLNTRPRQTLERMTLSDKLAEALQ